jgi:hypothetical protein
MKLLCTSIVALASFCITSTSLSDSWYPSPINTSNQFNGQANWDQFGYSVAIDGDTCVIGAFDADLNANNSGSAYIYTSDASGSWNKVAELSGEATGDAFGYSVAIDGDTCVIGAYGTNNGSSSGSAYVYTSNANGTWSHVDEFIAPPNSTFFGTRVAIDGDTCVIGAYGTNSNTGSAYVYTSDASGTWNQVAELSGEATGDAFGTSVAIDGDTCVIGAYGTNSGTGSAYVYTSDANSTWNQVAEFNGEASSNYFGYSVAIDGDTCVVGAPWANTIGSAYVYTSDASGTWNQVADCNGCGDGSGTWNQVAELNGEASNDYFGYSVAIDGDTCVIGAYGTNNGSSSGSAYVYTSNANGTWNQVAELGEANSTFFGTSVAIDGDTCVIGTNATNSYTGSAYLYGSNATTGACCVSSGCFDGTDNQCSAAGGTWTEAGSCDDCTPTCDGDINADGVVNIDDLLLLISYFGNTCM